MNNKPGRIKCKECGDIIRVDISNTCKCGLLIVENAGENYWVTGEHENVAPDAPPF